MALTTCWIGKNQSDEHKRKRAEALKGKPRTNETKEKLRLAFLGRKTGPQSPETIAKRVLARKATLEKKKLSQIT